MNLISLKYNKWLLQVGSCVSSIKVMCFKLELLHAFLFKYPKLPEPLNIDLKKNRIEWYHLIPNKLY